MSNDLITQLPEWESNDVIYNPIAVDDKEGRLAARGLIETYQDKLREFVGSEHGIRDELNANGLTEYFVGGAYIRSLFIPAGITIVSELWKKDRLWIIASGEVTLMTELGRRRVKGPFVEIAPYGSKVAFITHTEVLWLAVTGAESTNSKDIEEEVVTKEYSYFTYPWDKLEFKGEQECLG